MGLTMSGRAEVESGADRLIRMADAVERSPDYFGVLSSGERLAVAFLLNRPDWIARDGYTLAEALRRLGSHELATIIDAAELR